MKAKLSVREIRESDILPLTDYWMLSDSAHLVSMGVDLAKMPSREELEGMLRQQLAMSYPEKKSYAIIWLADEQPVGHSNINKIIFGEEAFMHLHLWNAAHRRQGFGTEFVKLTLPYFFKNYQLKKLLCEPYALNPAPNHTLKKAGFVFTKQYRTIPGSLNFEQEVLRWELTQEKFSETI